MSDEPDKPKKPAADVTWTPIYTPDFIVGHSFMHYVLVAVTEAFMRGPKP